MTPTKPHRLLLFVSGLVAVAIGAALVVDPFAFHATNQIALGTDPSLISEVRAPGGLLLVLGLMILHGARRASFAVPATALTAALYLSYGVARLVSLAVDGLPATGLVVATGIELLLGVAAGWTLGRVLSRDRGPSCATP